ncbi:unnamed protein product, partial [Urochloa humidicola]
AYGSGAGRSRPGPGRRLAWAAVPLDCGGLTSVDTTLGSGVGLRQVLLFPTSSSDPDCDGCRACRGKRA